MKHRFAALALTVCCTASAFAETNVGVSIDIYQPGVYGQINIGNLPPPRLIYAQPIVYAPTHVVVQQSPIYLYVPPDHRKNWGRHCGQYNACGRPVYFVQESWVRERHDEQHGHGNGKKNGKGKGKENGNH